MAPRVVKRGACASFVVWVALTSGCAREEPPRDDGAVTYEDGVEGAQLLGRLRERFGAKSLPRGPAQRLVVRDGALVADVESRLSVRLPLESDGALEIRAHDVAVRAWLEGASAVPVRVAEGLVLYDNEAGAQVLRVRDDGVEDWVEVHAGDALRYRLDVSRVAGLHLVAGVLELLDADGNPRIRVRPPELIDALGERRDASLSVSDCVVDHDPAPPWRRAPTAPGRDLCTLEVRWQGGGLRYPLLVDPQWQDPSVMYEKRSSHALTMLGPTEVLATGGRTLGEDPVPPPFVFTYLQSAEIYSVSGNAWTLLPAEMSQGRAFHTASLLPNNTVLVAGGRACVTCNPLGTAEVYDVSTSMWSPASPMNAARAEHTATVLPSSGGVLIVGNGAAEIYGTNNTWNNPLFDRKQHTSTLLGTTHVVVAGGLSTLNAPLDSTAIYDVGTSTWIPGPAMNQARYAHAAAEVGGQVLVAGGRTCASCPLSALAERLDPSVPTNSWSAAGPMNHPRAHFTLSPLPNGRLLAVGGAECFLQPGCAFDATAELFEPAGFGSWLPAFPAPYGALAAHAATPPLFDGSVLLSGGLSCQSGVTCENQQCTPFHHCMTLADAHRFVLSEQGAACTHAAECKSGHCVDGVCCDSACDSACSACAALLKASLLNDGVCGPAKSGEDDPRGLCLFEPASSCGPTGACDGAGNCALYAQNTPCMGATCVGELKTDAACDGQGSCVPHSTSCAPYSCVVDDCLAGCTTDADCAVSAFCDGSSCVFDKAAGDTCAADHECESGSCGDGVCCNAACEGQCEACNVPGSEGTCVPVDGDPVPPRPLCGSDDPSDPCAARRCDGVSRAECAGHPGADVACRAPSCSDGHEVHASSCDGQGQCAPPVGRDCTPYVCGEDACLESCDSDADCASGFVCRDGRCVAPSRCDGETTVVGSDGQRFACQPGYRCVDGSCADECDDTTACATGYVCDPEHRCVLPPNDSVSAENGSCACRTARPPARSWPACLLVLALTLVLRRRRAAGDR